MVKKQLIMDTALELFATQGFEATSVQQITEKCGISKGAFYLSFTSKDELIISLIDHFMMQFTADVDYVVRNTNEDILFHFYLTTAKSFHKHSDFAKILIKEQYVHKDLLTKMQQYDALVDKAILALIDRVYDKETDAIKYDLLYCIKGFMKNYSELYMFYNVTIDFDLMAKSLVEKTNILAQHTTIPFISEEFYHFVKQPLDEALTKEQIIDHIEQKLKELDESIEKDSLLLLRQQLQETTYHPAILKGLIENIRKHPQCKWISYLLKSYLDDKAN